MYDDLIIDSQISLRILKTSNDDIALRVKEILSNCEVRKFLPFKSNPTLIETQNFLNTIINAKSLVWVICLDEEVVGIIDLLNIEKKSANIAYFLNKKHWGKGIISGAIKEIINYSKSILNLHQLIAPVVSRNLASIKVLEKNGFTFHKLSSQIVNFDGKNDDVLFYALKL